MKQLGIIIVTYNTPNLLPVQLEKLRRFCKDDFDIIICDNSTEPEAIEAIKYHAEGCVYIKTSAASMNGSNSHAFASNVAYIKFKDDYEYLFFLDHDCMALKPFSIVEMLGEKLMIGLAQAKHKMYFWPGCFAFDARKVSHVDFATYPGLDTGGGTWKLIEEHGLENCVFLDEVYEQNPEFKKSQYDFYSIIGGTFFHCLAGSNWCNAEHHEERINSLLNILKKRTDES